MKRFRHIDIFLGLVLLGSFGFSCSLHATGKCEIEDLQKCSSCEGLERTIDLDQPDRGEYYRGAYWNGLFSAYKLNCIDVAKKLLDHHANPNLGGTYGSFLVTISRAWPHNKETINKKWADLLNGYSLDANWQNPYTGESAKEILSNEAISVDYPDIWKMLTEKSKPQKEPKK